MAARRDAGDGDLFAGCLESSAQLADLAREAGVVVRVARQPLAPGSIQKSVQWQDIRTIPNRVAALRFHCVKLAYQHPRQPSSGGENGGAFLKRAENLLMHVLS